MSVQSLRYTDDPFAWLGQSSAPSAGATQAEIDAYFDANPDKVERAATTAADARNVAELQRRIKANNGVVIAGPNSSDYIVAVNNTLRFSVTRRADGSYEIRESQYFWLLIGAAALVGVLLIANR